MFEWFKSSDDAIDLLKRDHDSVKDLFEKFENSKSQAQKKKTADRAIAELKAHAAIEEEIFYPTVRKHLGKDIMTEADEEHHVAKVLIAELEQMSGRESHYDAKFTVLAENVRHHIKEEEGEMLPEARKFGIDYVALGQVMMARKEEVLAEGLPPSSEELMVAKGGNADSPAKAAATRKRVKKTKAA